MFPTKTSNQPGIETENLTKCELENSQPLYFFEEVLEGLKDGVLILSDTGEILHANGVAVHISSLLNQDSSQSNVVPSAIWNICQSLIDNRTLLSNKFLVISSDIVLDRSNVFRTRVRWLDLDRLGISCLLVTIEDRYESLKNLVKSEAIKYQLTSREAEIWFFYRAQYSYKDIAAELYITINTVKKHMKNIHAKRQAFLAFEEIENYQHQRAS
ncbi:MAG: LuxR C-terminal-related transcriptional regulator [Nostocaceae cyanobacterium]|nr:LuxR C-terminal-related transcriptional regulator [Nostocaceae cyanobacterium]